MQCPVCTTSHLQMTERQGVEIDYCPKCRGVWLDRGELDKLIERSAPASPGPAPVGGYRRDDDDDDDDRWKRQAPAAGYPQQPYKKKSILRELFDF
jgi:Zn-finger nucleic acid-binding protein